MGAVCSQATELQHMRGLWLWEITDGFADDVGRDRHEARAKRRQREFTLTDSRGASLQLVEHSP